MWIDLAADIASMFSELEGHFDRREENLRVTVRRRIERAGPGRKRGPKPKGRRASCHADRAHYAKGLCVGCYNRPRRDAWRASKRAAA